MTIDGTSRFKTLSQIGETVKKNASTKGHISIDSLLASVNRQAGTARTCTVQGTVQLIWGRPVLLAYIYGTGWNC